MIDKYYFEFSKLYCRIMRLEMQMKKKLISSVVGYYKDEVITEFNKFFYNKESVYFFCNYNNISQQFYPPLLINVNTINICYISKSDIIDIDSNCQISAIMSYRPYGRYLKIFLHK